MASAFERQGSMKKTILFFSIFFLCFASSAESKEESDYVKHVGSKLQTGDYIGTKQLLNILTNPLS